VKEQTDKNESQPVHLGVARGKVRSPTGEYDHAHIVADRPLVQVKRIGDHALPIPTYATDGAAGFDLRNAGPRVVLPCAWFQYPSLRTRDPMPGANTPMWLPIGFAIEIPPGYEGQIRGRSGLAAKHSVVAFHPGTIDSDFRGEPKVALVNWGTEDFVIEPGDRIAQLVIAPVARALLVEVDALSETVRGEGGYGSTGVK